MSCRYWGLNNPFAAYAAAETAGAFQWAKQLPKIANSRGGTPYLTHGKIIGPTWVSPINSISIGSAVFAQYVSVTNVTQTHISCCVWHLSQQTTSMLCMRCGLTETRCSRRWQTSSLVPPPGELGESYGRFWFGHMETRRHQQNRKYIKYRIVAEEDQATAKGSCVYRKFSEIWTCGFKDVSRQQDKQTDTHTHDVRNTTHTYRGRGDVTKTYITVERVDGDVERGVVPLHLLCLLLLLSADTTST